MNNISIEVQKLSKAYQLGQFSTGTLSQDFNRWLSLFMGKEDPYLKIGESNDRTKKSENNIVWSLKDINFAIEQGTAVGIIGKNGSGKSTLLKILSQITSPTLGNVKIKGRVASLLEVGTGFHPELTGRENIFLNGAILGMKKYEIKAKFDEIVAFSGIERYIDTPVKRYSSGMYVRLAFAVAAHLESEILVVDEVLAVGDAEFQKKCLGKMDDISKSQGRTILFVSHHMPSIKELVDQVLVLDKGEFKIISNDVESTINSYLANSINELDCRWINKAFKKELVDIYHFSSEIIDGNNINKSVYHNDESINLKVVVYLQKYEPNLLISCNILKPSGEPIIRLHFDDFKESIREKVDSPQFMEVLYTIPPFFLSTGKYILSFDVAIHNVIKYSSDESNLSFEVIADNEIGNRFNYHNSFIANSIVRPNLLNSIKYYE